MISISALKVLGLFFPGGVIAVLLLFALDETFGGDWSGLRHLVQAIPIGLLMWLGWKRPLWGGMFLLVLSLLASYSFAEILRRPDWLGPFLIIIAPVFISGVLLPGVARLESRTV